MWGITAEISAFALFLVALIFSIAFWRRILEYEIKREKGILDARISAAKTLERELEDLGRETERMQKKLMDVSNIYTVTKEMSFNIRFESLFSALGGFMRENFLFKKIIMAVLKEEKNAGGTEKIYALNDKITSQEPLDAYYRKAFDFVLRTNAPVFAEEDSDMAKKLGLDDTRGNLLAIPLSMGREVLAVIFVEGARKENYDDFLILASQIALQVRKVHLFEKVERLSIIDGLTGAFLRRHFMELLVGEIERSRAHRMQMSILIADIDFFKKQNDKFGHLVGDAILKDTAELIKKTIREIDIVSRYGGEEFCVMLPETKNADAAMIGERIRRAIENHRIEAYDETTQITVSMGISSYPADGNTKDALIEKADNALYRAKREGRNRVCLAN